MLKQKQPIKSISQSRNLNLKRSEDIAVDPSEVLLGISISYPPTPLNPPTPLDPPTPFYPPTPLDPPTILDPPISFHPPTSIDDKYKNHDSCSTGMEEKSPRAQQEFSDQIAELLPPKENLISIESFLELEKKYVQLSDSYQQLLQENLKFQTENIKLWQELEWYRKNTIDLQVKLHSFQDGANIFQKQYFSLQKQNVELAKKLCELQHELTSIQLREVENLQQQNSVTTLGGRSVNPPIVGGYEALQHNISSNRLMPSTLFYQLHARYQHPPYKDPPNQHVPFLQSSLPYTHDSRHHVVDEEPSTNQQATCQDPVSENAPYKEAEEDVTIPQNIEAASSTNTQQPQFSSAIQYMSDSYNLLRLIKLQHEHAAKRTKSKPKYIPT